MSSTPLLGVRVKDLQQQHRRNTLNPCMGLSLCWTFNSTKAGESRTLTRWAAKSHLGLGSLEAHHAAEGTSEDTTSISADAEWGCGTVGAKQLCCRASLGFHEEIQRCFGWLSSGKATWRKTLSSCYWPFAQQSFLQQTQPLQPHHGAPPQNRLNQWLFF